MVRNRRTSHDGAAELRAAWRVDARFVLAAAVFSFFANILMLTGPLYMLQVYDRVLGSGSVETLISLSLIAVFLFATMAALDIARSRLMARVGARFHSRLDARVIDASSRQKDRDGTGSGASDLEAIRGLVSSPALTAVFDAPWTPLLLAAIAVFHPALGLLAIGGGAVLILLTAMTQLTTRHLNSTATEAFLVSEGFGDQLRAGADTIAATGQRNAMAKRWSALRFDAATASLLASDRTGTFGIATKTCRTMLQSAMIGLGGYLVIQGSLSAGAMIAASILTGRALAPLETIIAHWPVVDRGIRAWRSLGQLLSTVPPATPRIQLPTPRARLDINDLTVVPPGSSTASLRMLSFSLGPGQAIGVIGKSGCGKSSLAKALTGVWPAAGGTIRLDGAHLSHYGENALGQYIGALPQRVDLFPGTIADNIARFVEKPNAQSIISAAQLAHAHEMTLSLPDGYDTKIGPYSSGLSGGQTQRIGLARALYGDPKVVVLDEPNSNLDNDGDVALSQTLRHLKSAGKACIVMAHRPAAIMECDAILVLEGGRQVAFGPRDDIIGTARQSPTTDAEPLQGRLA